mgnify:CR=1 FL=1
MPKKGRFDFTKKNKRSGKIENVGYLDLEQDEEQSRCSLYFYGALYQRHGNPCGTRRTMPAGHRRFSQSVRRL